MSVLDMDFAPTADDLLDEVTLSDVDVDAWMTQMLAGDADQTDQDDPFGLGVDPYAENTVEQSEDEVWGDDSDDHTYAFEVEVRTVTPVAVTPVTVAEVVPSAADYREALRAAGVPVGTRGRLSSDQTWMAQALLAA